MITYQISINLQMLFARFLAAVVGYDVRKEVEYIGNLVSNIFRIDHYRRYHQHHRN